MKNGIDFSKEDIPGKKPMILTLKTSIDSTLNRTRIIPQISNMKKKISETFVRSCRMKLSGTAEFIASRNWDKVPLPNGEWEESNDQDEKKPWILPERVRLFIVFLDLLYNLIPLSMKAKK